MSDLQERISEAVGRDRVARYGPAAEGDLSLADLGALRSKALVLDADMRSMLATLGDHYGHAMLRLIEERDAAVGLAQERLDAMAGQADRWFEFADAMRDKRPVKHAGAKVEAPSRRVEDGQDELPMGAEPAPRDGRSS